MGVKRERSNIEEPQNGTEEQTWQIVFLVLAGMIFLWDAGSGEAFVVVHCDFVICRGRTTMNWRSIEQLLNVEYGLQVDQWALGCDLFTLYT